MAVTDVDTRLAPVDVRVDRVVGTIRVASGPRDDVLVRRLRDLLRERLPELLHRHMSVANVGDVDLTIDKLRLNLGVLHRPNLEETFENSLSRGVQSLAQSVLSVRDRDARRTKPSLTVLQHLADALKFGGTPMSDRDGIGSSDSLGQRMDAAIKETPQETTKLLRGLLSRTSPTERMARFLTWSEFERLVVFLDPENGRGALKLVPPNSKTGARGIDIKRAFLGLLAHPPASLNAWQRALFEELSELFATIDDAPGPIDPSASPGNRADITVLLEAIQKDDGRRLLRALTIDDLATWIKRGLRIDAAQTAKVVLTMLVLEPAFGQAVKQKMGVSELDHLLTPILEVAGLSLSQWLQLAEPMPPTTAREALWQLFVAHAAPVDAAHSSRGKEARLQVLEALTRGLLNTAQKHLKTTPAKAAFDLAVRTKVLSRDTSAYRSFLPVVLGRLKETTRNDPKASRMNWDDIVTLSAKAVGAEQPDSIDLDRTDRSDDVTDGEDAIYPTGRPLPVTAAGLTLLWPFFKRLFSDLEFLEDQAFKSEAVAARAARVLFDVAFPGEMVSEPQLLLPRILCGVPSGTVIVPSDAITANEKTASTEMLTAAMSAWPQMKGTSLDGFRQSFVQRSGMLEISDDRIDISVEGAPYDMLLDTLPWPRSIIKLPWRSKLIHVRWT